MPLKSAMSARFRMIAASSTVLPPDQGSAVPSCARSRAISSSTATPGPSRPSASGASCRRTATTGVRFRPCVSSVAASRGGRASTRPGAWRATSTTCASPGMLHGRTVRTTIPRGELLARPPRLRPAGFTIVDHRDIPGRNVVAADPGRPAVPRRARDPPRRGAGAAPRPRGPRGARARARVRLDVRARRARSSTPSAPRHVFKEITIEKGDLARGFAEAAVVVEGEYRDGPPGARLHRAAGRRSRCPATAAITVYGSLQCPYYVHKALVTLLGLPRRAACASCRPRRAAASAARRSTRRSSPATRRCSP